MEVLLKDIAIELSALRSQEQDIERQLPSCTKTEPLLRSGTTNGRQERCSWKNFGLTHLGLNAQQRKLDGESRMNPTKLALWRLNYRIPRREGITLRC